ncbi:zinc finger RNA-binding protein-like isoform X3 [Xenia sp. Carnegie-2017]|uniref:zinc finger RNA-binding protein-like isoform X3 n=1 Tax=Xenia sp. Carnegie-2017 TaxID=2897299 RepID=UPI001F03DA4D|nr:zinc finger RNA-binding protein-like isoform X3 [Xenia sp. Carnegie-2017]
MAANSNYYGYSTGVQSSQVYGGAMQNPQMAATAYNAQNTSAYGVQSATPSVYGTATQQRVAMTAQAPYTPTAASSYQAAGMSGSSYGYTARAQDTTGQSYQTNTPSAYASATSYYGARDNSQTSNASAYDASKTTNYYGQQQPQQQHTAANQGYGYGAGAPKAMYSGYSATPNNPVIQMANHNVQKPNNVPTANVSYPNYKPQSNTNYTQNAASGYNSHSNWSNPGSGFQPTQGQGYDAAVYNAASSFFQQQTQPRQKWGSQKSNNQHNQNKSHQQNRQRNPPRQQQMHYCDVCKISCAGPQTYREHLEGQKHKKKEAAQKQMEAAGPEGYKCSLCDVICTGTDAFNAHLRGAKHLKTVKLLEKLGKPVPTVLSAEDQDKEKQKEGIVKPQSIKNSFRGNQRRNRKTSAPKITFISGAPLNTSANKVEEQSNDAVTTEASDQKKEDASATPEEGKYNKFVGEDYVEEVRNDGGKVIAFECKLCECKFNDTQAREAHLKGRRHQLAYKKKVQPDYVLDQKSSNRNRPTTQPRSLMDEKARRRWEQDMYWRQQEAAWRNEEVRRWGEEEYWRRLEEEERAWEEQEGHRHSMEWGHRIGSGSRSDFMHHDMYPPANMLRPRQDSQDDRMVMSKHKLIYPNEEELAAVQSIVSAVEKALKLVSDSIAEEDAPVVVKQETIGVGEESETLGKTEENGEEGKDSETQDQKQSQNGEKTDDDAKLAGKSKEKDEEAPAPRTLKGVMRVGVLAKGLLLHKRLDVELVVLCQDRPTTQLLERVFQKIPDQLTNVSDEKYDVSHDGCVISVKSTKEPFIVVTIILTSPVIREESDVAQAEEQKDVLDREKCLEALASLRHAKWFQAKANSVPSCVVIIRILRDMRDRLPVFASLNPWLISIQINLTNKSRRKDVPTQ